FDHGLSQNRDQKTEDRHAHHDQNDRERASRGRQRVRLAVPDGGQRDHGHIQTVKPRPAFDRAITDRAEEDRGDDGDQWVYESISQRHWECGLRISDFGFGFCEFLSYLTTGARTTIESLLQREPRNDKRNTT